jgi:dihydroorotate dehydrogenase electron transfer subunit
MPLQKEHNLLTLIPLSPVREPVPGQFYMIGMEGDYDPLLKRPFSLLRRTEEGLQILYRIRGRGTALLRNMREGSVIDVLGPLGNSYPMPAKDHIPVIVAGGVGIASLFFLAERLSGRAAIFYGARRSDELVMMDELRELADDLFISTEDGSYGEKGTILEVLQQYLARDPSRESRHLIYACGPRLMLEALRRMTVPRRMRAYVTLEENMACGIGACLGCVVKTTEGHKRVCKEGPIFAIDEIVW